MGLFNRKKKQDDDSNSSGEVKKEKGAWRRPANTAFKQQRLKAWQPILTPKTVLPTLFLIGIVFAPIGGLLVWGSSLVSEMSFDYSDCEKLTPSTSIDSPNFSTLPPSKYTYRMRSADAKDANPAQPRYAFFDNSANSSIDVSKKRQCIVEFDIPAELEKPVFFYYKLTNFFQNHRRYVKSLNSDQLKGKAVSTSDLEDSDCKPLATVTINNTRVPIYPCGLIANSVFNDTLSNPVLLNPSGGGPSETYDFSYSGIAWPGEAKKYVSTPGYTDLSGIVPPPNWHDRFPSGYTSENPPPDLSKDEHFQNWMRTAGLPTFTKLYGRNDTQNMLKGSYRIVIDLNYPVLSYKGTKSFVISTVSWIGGKNPFLGWAYVAAAGVFVLLAILGTARHLIKPRRLGDMSLLSWNK